MKTILLKPNWRIYIPAEIRKELGLTNSTQAKKNRSTSTKFETILITQK